MAAKRHKSTTTGITTLMPIFADSERPELVLEDGGGIGLAVVGGLNFISTI